MLYNSLANPAGVRFLIPEDQLFLIPEEVVLAASRTYLINVIVKG